MVEVVEVEVVVVLVPVVVFEVVDVVVLVPVLTDWTGRVLVAVFLSSLLLPASCTYGM